jgi:FkbM family methyltransferase
MASIFYANRYPAARVVAVEAEASNYAALVTNARAYPNIVPIHAALWRTDGQVEVFPPWPQWMGWGE